MDKLWAFPIERIQEEGTRLWDWIEIVAKEESRTAQDLVLDGSDGAVFTPVEVGREAVGGEDRRLMRRRPLEQVPSGGAAEAEELPPELGGGEVRELGDPVHRRGVEPLVAPREEKIGPEHGHPACALFVVAVGLAEPPDEAREVRFSSRSSSAPSPTTCSMSGSSAAEASGEQSAAVEKRKARRRRRRRRRAMAIGRVEGFFFLSAV